MRLLQRRNKAQLRENLTAKHKATPVKRSSFVSFYKLLTIVKIIECDQILMFSRTFAGFPCSAALLLEDSSTAVF